LSDSRWVKMHRPSSFAGFGGSSGPGHAIDKQQLVNIVLLGEGNPGLTLIPEALSPWYNTTLKDYSFDVALANQMLDQAGYKDIDGDGIREMPDGSKKLEFRFNWPSDSTVAPRAAELISTMWSKIGVKLDLQAWILMRSLRFVAPLMITTLSSGAGALILILPSC